MSSGGGNSSGAQFGTGTTVLSAPGSTTSSVNLMNQAGMNAL